MGRLTPFLDDIALAVFVLAAVLLLAPDWVGWALLALAIYIAAKVWLFRSHLRRPAIGVEAMQGRVGTALEDLTPRGPVDLDGELWQAESAQPVRAGEKVQVTAVEGLMLKVAPLGTTGTAYSPPRPSLLLGLARRFRRS